MRYKLLLLREGVVNRDGGQNVDFHDVSEKRLSPAISFY